MGRSAVLSALLSCLAWTPVCAQVNQWTNVGPVGGRMPFLVIDPTDPTTFYAGSAVGVFKSQDSGTSWINTGMVATGLVIDPKNPATLYALAPTDDGSIATRLFKSTDGGATWNEVFWLPPGSSMLTIDPQGTLYAVAGNPPHFLYKSTDGGVNWIVLPALPNSAYFVHLAVDPQNAGTLYAAAIGNIAGRSLVTVYKSRDGGASWSQSGSGLPANGGFFTSRALTIDPKNPGTLYVTMASGAYKSTDGGASWRAANSGLPTTNQMLISGVVIDPQNPSKLYAPFFAPRMNGAIFKSSNGGLNWSAVNSGVLPPGSGFLPGVGGLVIDRQNTDTIYALTENGMSRSMDGGATWNVYFRPRAIPVSSLVMDPLNSGTIYAGSYKSTDAGMSWVPLGAGTVALAIDPQTPSTLYGGGVEDCGDALSGGFLKSVDGGGTWIDTRSRIDCLSAIVADPQTPGTIYAVSNGVNKSTDGGTSWLSLNSGLPGGTAAGAVRFLAIDPQNTATLYATLYDGRLFKIADAAATWSDTGVPAKSNTVAIDPQQPGTVYAGTSSGLFKSGDGGASWRNLSLSANVYAIAINPQSSGTIYVGMDSGVARSTDGGETWTPMPGAPPNVRLLALDPQDPNTLYANGPGGLFAVTIDAGQ
jgi:photosystem II stability/assembly factor-like uncharacterized protein